MRETTLQTPRSYWSHNWNKIGHFREDAAAPNPEAAKPNGQIAKTAESTLQKCSCVGGCALITIVQHTMAGLQLAEGRQSFLYHCVTVCSFFMRK
jgi:hypothetical protein